MSKNFRGGFFFDSHCIWQHSIPSQKHCHPLLLKLSVIFGLCIFRTFRHSWKVLPHQFQNVLFTYLASRRHLFSAKRHHLVVPRHNLNTYNGRRAFAVAGPAVWNSLSDDLPSAWSGAYQLALTVSDVCLNWFVCRVVVHPTRCVMRYINLQRTYLLTYLLTWNGSEIIG